MMLKRENWIQSPVDTKPAACTFFVSISLKKKVSSAKMEITSVGNYALFINSWRIGKGVLTPGWTSYPHRIQTQTYRVTKALSAQNEIAVTVGNGWGVDFRRNWTKNQDHCFQQSALNATLTVVYEDGERQSFSTGTHWDVFTSQVRNSGIYFGETVDKTHQPTKIGKAVKANIPSRTVSQVGEWIVENERLSPIQLLVTPKGEKVLDFGQNLTGYVELKIKGPRGSRVVLHHAEVLDKDGNFYTANMRDATNETVYVLSGEEDVFKPLFSFQGFRYVQLVEYPFDQVDFSHFCAVAVHSELKRTGSFVCGNAKINQLYHNIIWGQKGNYLDIPTDCPQRDERLGWTGDAQVFIHTAAINFDVEKFFKKWLGDMALDQAADGRIPHVIPDCFEGKDSSAGWADAACIVPWELYRVYGNVEELRRHYPMMKRWVDYLRSAGSEEALWLGGTHFGDWLAMDQPTGDELVGATSTDFIASAYYAHSLSLLIKAGCALGKDLAEYISLYSRVLCAFRKRFLTKEYLKTQTAYALVLAFNLCEDKDKKAYAARLAQMVKDNQNRMTTGFLGTRYILSALSENGYADVAYNLLFQEKNPSWLYAVNHGATTVWEHWNGIKEDGSFWSADMNSFNHYAYGAVFGWMFDTVAGIRQLEDSVAYSHVQIAPHPEARLGFADTSLQTRKGLLRSYWKTKENKVRYSFSVPKGCVAELVLPTGRRETLQEGSYEFFE